jgi:hypothetical protein
MSQARSGVVPRQMPCVP